MTATDGTVTVRHVDGNGTWLVALHGEHDAFTVPHLAERTEVVWSRSTHAIIDLSDAQFIDSSVIGWVLRARTHADARRIVLVEGSASIANRVLDVTGLRDIFPCYPCLEDALGADPHDEPHGAVVLPDRGIPTADS
jgi:anti-anti-sigma factor